MSYVESIFSHICERGPDRVVVNFEGYAMPHRKAVHAGVPWDIVFVRNDGWTLGAPSHLEALAYDTWPKLWTHFIRRDPQTRALGPLQPISEYRRAA